jgi:hypothetical protein
LNPRPSDYKSDALPAELRQRRSNRARIADEACELQAAERPPSTPAATIVEKPDAVSMPVVRATFLFSTIYKELPRIPDFAPGGLCKIAKLFLDCSGYLDDRAAFQ